MFGIKNYKDLTKENILEVISEEQLLEYYVTKQNQKIRCPFHNDKTPSLGVKGNRFKCFGCGEAGDVFGFIQKKYSMTFYECIKLINSDFNLKLGSNEKVKTNPILIGKESTTKKNKSSRISVKIIRWSKRNYQYWKEYGISLKTLKRYNIFPVKWYRINRYTFKSKSFTYAYQINKDNFFKWKILRPFEKKELKWFTNMNQSDIHGWEQLPQKGNLLIITKSLKDVCLFSEYGICSIAPSAESVIIDEKTINNLKKRFKTIITLFDYDIAGVKLANKFYKKYNIPYMFFKDCDFKDFTEFRKKYGKEETKELILNINKLYD